MRSAQDDEGRGMPVERYHATNGRFVGFLSLAVIAAIVVYVVVGVHSVEGLRLGTGALFFGVLVWVTQLRPSALAFREVLRLQNSIRDVDVPFALVDDVHVGRMLSVWVGKERYVCIGIGAPLRKAVKARGRGSASLFGWDRLEADSKHPRPPLPQEAVMSYPQFVESRIATLVEEAKRRAATSGATDERPRKSWAWSGIVALAVTGAAFLVSLLV